MGHPWVWSAPVLGCSVIEVRFGSQVGSDVRSMQQSRSASVAQSLLVLVVDEAEARLAAGLQRLKDPT